MCLLGGTPYFHLPFPFTPVGLFHSCSCWCCSSVMFNLFIAVNIHCLDMVAYLVCGLKEMRQTNVWLQREREEPEQKRQLFEEWQQWEEQNPWILRKSFKWNRWNTIIYIIICHGRVYKDQRNIMHTIEHKAHNEDNVWKTCTSNFSKYNFISKQPLPDVPILTLLLMVSKEINY